MELYKNKEWMYDHYVNEKLLPKEIAKICECGKTTIYRWLDNLNIPKRTYSEARILLGDNHSSKRPEVRKKISEVTKGKNNPRWKGGKTKSNKGYIYIYSPDHPFKDKRNYVFEHRLVAESSLRKYNPESKALIEINGEKYLRNDWAPHHINGIRNDNRWNNLSVMLKKSHDRFHTQGEKNPFYGKHHTEETKQKMREKAKKHLINR